MSVVQRLAKLRHVLIIPLALTSLLGLPSIAQAEEIIIREAPPPMRMEPVPMERPGYAWDRGHWRWAGRGYEWQPGHWQPVMRGARWEPGHWVPHGPTWAWEEGHWVR